MAWNPNEDGGYLGPLPQQPSVMDQLRNQTAMQTPGLQIRGEVPYGVPKENILARIRRKLGDERIAGLIGALTMPEGLIDPVTDQREGPSPFQAGLMGYTQGTQGYRDRIAQQQKLQQDQAIANREIAAKETTAGAAAERARHYGTWVGRASNPRMDLDDKLTWFKNLSPEDQQLALSTGLVPGQRSRTQAQDNEDMHVQSLMSQYEGMNEDDARLLIRNKPLRLSTGTRYDLSGYNKGKGVAEIRNTTQYGVSRLVKQTLDKYGLKPDDVYGFLDASAPTYETGPQSREEVEGADRATIAGWLQSGVLKDPQLDMIQDWLDIHGDEEEEAAPLPVPRDRNRFR